MGKFARKLDDEFPLHITARCNNKEDFPVPLSEAWEIFSEYLFMLHYGYKIKIHSFILMTNHFHLLASDPELNLSKAMALFMRETSKEMGHLSHRINRVWGAPFHSCIISDYRYFLSAYKYNYRNPVAAGITDRVENYPWSTLQVLLGKRKGIIPLLEDQILMNDPSGTLHWLNESYQQEEFEAIHKATQKNIFKIARNETTNRKIIF